MTKIGLEPEKRTKLRELVTNLDTLKVNMLKSPITIEEDLTECERIKLLLSKRDPNQFSYVFLNAMNIFRDDVEMQAEILPLLVEKIRTYTEDQ